jgi:hypothetical protein
MEIFFIHTFCRFICTVTTTVNEHAAWVLGMHTKDLSHIVSKKLGATFPGHQQQQQLLSLLSQASWGRLEMKPTESKNKKHKKGTSQRKR